MGFNSKNTSPWIHYRHAIKLHFRHAGHHTYKSIQAIILQMNVSLRRIEQIQIYIIKLFKITILRQKLHIEADIIKLEEYGHLRGETSNKLL